MVLFAINILKEVSSFTFQVSGFRFQVSGFRFQVSGLKLLKKFVEP